MTTGPDADVVSLYQSGLSLREVGRRVGLTAPSVATRLDRAGVPRRPQGGSKRGHVKRDGPTTYSGRHTRVALIRGRPDGCTACGTTEPRRYEWANLTGNYDDIWDYARMCVPCHRKFDNQRKREANTWTTTSLA